jgi:hypothetical protein
MNRLVHHRDAAVAMAVSLAVTFALIAAVAAASTG